MKVGLGANMQYSPPKVMLCLEVLNSKRKRALLLSLACPLMQENVALPRNLVEFSGILLPKRTSSLMLVMLENDITSVEEGRTRDRVDKFTQGITFLRLLCQ